VVHYSDSPAEAEFRAEFRDWLGKHAIMEAEIDASGDVGTPDWLALKREWHRRLYEGGYCGMTWPEEYGGRGLTSIYDAILAEEVGRWGAAPLPAYTSFVGKLIYRFGTEEQIKRYLQPLQSGEELWCQGFSEPGAGSDLASLRTRADRQGDVYIVNGQKLWTSGSDFSDFCFLLVRTDQEAPKHQGITCLLVDMKTPGILAQPILLTNGEPDTATVFWDDVEVPVSSRLGEENAGWRIAVSVLSDERGPESVRLVAHHRKHLAKLTELVHELGVADDREVQRAVGSLYADGEAHRLYVNDLLSAIDNGTSTGLEGSIAKLLWSQETQELHHVAMDLLGARAITGDAGHWFDAYLWSRPASIYGGTSQIQKNLIAQRWLGMPRR
jgi:alkylation response protein AidB-like acyl-CoA dehydrogenase